MKLAARFTPLAGAAAMLLAFAAPAAQAQGGDPEGTLKKIRDDGAISLGVHESSVPFAYADSAGHTTGYSYAIALLIVDEIKRELNLPGLVVREVPITPQNRIPLMTSSQIDLECGSTTHTHARDDQVAFSDSFFQYAVRMLVKKTSGIADYRDLAGKPVVTTAGSSDERLLRKLDSDQHLNMRIMSVRDHPEAFEALRTDRAVAYVMDEPLLYGNKAEAARPGDYAIVGPPLRHEVYACMLRKGDAPFKKLVDRVIDRLETSGEAQKLYDMWFTQPIPPRGLNLDYPIPDEMKALFAHPNDKPLD
ncbi:transporter substrate-binding domain-containing protein [Trinickia terrae]|uniref:Transporter substrate-binding domain-containing protein n=1 Tax=Trinickia terrae TaxID=2571161 RepID=A0A4U1HL79_9BURK|nr:transporter substrate-binding domain-containing protein [Trinickia terrae]TKC80367.1 transporter substrate-binding domain-containing protein [Trinickia terrae]